MDAETDCHKKFLTALLQHSTNKTDKNAATKEWTALSADAHKCDLKGGLSEDLIQHHKIDVAKLPERVYNCICSHRIKKNKFIYNMYNKKLLTVGSHCIRRYLSYTTKKLCRECETPFVPEGRRGRGKSRDYCSSCKFNWCINRGYRRRGCKWMRRRGRSMRANFYNLENEGREAEFCGEGTSMSYNPSATLVSYNPSADNVNLNLIQLVEALKFQNKSVLFKYLESQEYLQGTKKINFGKYSEKPLKDFNDPSYYNWFTKTIKKPYDEQLAFYFYVTYINKKF